MADEPIVTETKPVIQEVVKEEPIKKPIVKDALRELSQLFSVNLFDDENAVSVIKSIKEKADKLPTLESEYLKKEETYKLQIEALGMGFKRENLDEVMALAKVNQKQGQSIMDGLKVVQAKYGSVFTTAQIGIQHNDNRDKPDIAKSEQEEYLAKSRAVQTWTKTKQ